MFQGTIVFLGMKIGSRFVERRDRRRLTSPSESSSTSFYRPSRQQYEQYFGQEEPPLRVVTDVMVSDNELPKPVSDEDLDEMIVQITDIGPGVYGNDPLLAAAMDHRECELLEHDDKFAAFMADNRRWQWPAVGHNTVLLPGHAYNLTALTWDNSGVVYRRKDLMPIGFESSDDTFITGLRRMVLLREVQLWNLNHPDNIVKVGPSRKRKKRPAPQKQEVA